MPSNSKTLTSPSPSRVAEPFILSAQLSLLIASGWMFLSRDLLLQYFYFSRLLALTHLVTLGFLSSLMMGVLYRLSPMLYGVEGASRRVGYWQCAFFLVGVWGMIAHFLIGESRGMSWSTFLVLAAALLQLWNFRALARVRAASVKKTWSARFVFASLFYFVVAAGIGVLLGLVKGYDVRVPFLSPSYIDNVFAHAHVAGGGWVMMMIFGVQFELVPTTTGAVRSLPIRFTALQVGVIGLLVAFVTDRSVLVPALILVAVCAWQLIGPVRALISGRAREWAVLPLFVLVGAAGIGVALASGVPDPVSASELRGRVQLAYGFLALIGFMTLTVIVVAFKLFPMWVWKERFHRDFGKLPVPGMKELESETLRLVSNLCGFAGASGTALAVVLAHEGLLFVSTALWLVAVVSFFANFVRVARWALFDLTYRPSAEDEVKFEQMFGRKPPSTST